MEELIYTVLLWYTTHVVSAFTMEGMKTVRSNIYLLMGRKSQREGRRLTLRMVSDESGVNYATLSNIATERIKQYPKDTLAKLCTYFNCDVGDLLTVAELPDDDG